MIRPFVIVLLILVAFAGCTRDDICPEDTQTTPLLTIQFRDITNRLQAKAVTSLRVLIINPDTIEAFQGESDTLIGLPLNTLASRTEFRFINNSNDTINANTDVLSFTYSTEDIYINRACAFKTIYNEVQADLEPEAGTNWIEDLTLLKTTIEDETEAHLTIFH